MSKTLVFIDTHCHLNFAQFDPDRDAVVQRALDAGVVALINPAVDLNTSEQAMALAHRYPGVFAQVGVHPNSAQEVMDGGIDRLEVFASDPRVVAVGEIGLDYHWNVYPREVQERAFWAQLEMAAEQGVPVAIHSRNAQADTFAVLEAWAREVDRGHLPLATRPFKGVWHSFQGEVELAQKVLDLNMRISLGGPVTFTNAHEVHALVRALPLGALMLETDAPFLSPHPLRGKRNEPCRIPLIAQAIADLKGITVDEVARVTTANAIRCFQLPGQHYIT